MTSTYGKAKQDIKRARAHIAGIVGRIGWIEQEYETHACIKQFFESFKPFLVQADESLITLMHMVVDPEPYNQALKEIKNGNANTKQINPRIGR